MVMVSMRPRSHGEKKIHDSTKNKQYKVRASGIEILDARWGNRNLGVHRRCNSRSSSG
jgi:hypothetical protein